ncbi:MAG TPA: DNA repair protein RecN [Pseudomonadota bacterium]|nr:DNA repair protein RecN [Pseudomonadota bacterium]
MLSYLRISNFAIIKEAELLLGRGMTVLSGETGAGKSLILNAVALLRGERARNELIRDGADEALIEAVFSFQPGSAAKQALLVRLAQHGFDTSGIEEDGLSVRRVLSRTGRNRIHIHGQLATTAALSDICGHLLDVSGQHEHQCLLDVSQHVDLLDRFGVPPALREKMAEAYAALAQAGEKLARASLSEKQRREREEFLRFQLDELEKASPEVGEDERLRAEQKRLRSLDKLLLAAQRSEGKLESGENCILDGLSQVLRDLREVAPLDAAFSELCKRVEETQVLLRDTAHELRRAVGTLAGDPERLLLIDERLHVLARLCRKHGPDLQTVLAKHKDLQQELHELLSHEEMQAQAQKEVLAAKETAAQVAGTLHAARIEAGRRLSEQAGRELRDLGMSGATLVPQLLPRLLAKQATVGEDPAFGWTEKDPTGEGENLTRRIGPDGWDRCELLFSANSGEAPRPLQKIASGGELSRVMLALRGALGQADPVTTCVFDEVDSGIGGATADRVGQKIRTLAEKKQVLCISHLAQIACYAEHHFRVEKVTEKGRTVTQVNPLSDAARKDEIARMIGGGKLTPKSRAHAHELLLHALAQVEKRLLAHTPKRKATSRLPQTVEPTGARTD